MNNEQKTALREFLLRIKDLIEAPRDSDAENEALEAVIEAGERMGEVLPD